MSDLKCPKCGRPSSGLCAGCFIADNPLTIKLESFKECACGLVYFKGKRFENKEEMLLELAEKSIKPPLGVKVNILDVNSEYRGGQLIMKVDVVSSYDNISLKRELKWELRPKHVTCDNCRKLNSGYFEAVFQVRGEGVDFVIDPKHVGNIERVRGGVDYYLISNDYARLKVSELISKGFLVKSSSKLFGKKRGKDAYRYYYSIKKLPSDVGDFIEYNKKLLRVVEVAKTVKLQDVISGRTTSATVNNLKDSKVPAKSSDVAKAIVTEVRPSGMQIMDEVNCETYEVPVKEGLVQGQEVEYLKLKEKVYIL